MKVAITEIFENKKNPRFIKDEKFKKLVKSIKDFPEMLAVRKIVVDENMIVLGGNMRLRALKEAGVKEVEIEKVNWTQEQKDEFLIKDNLGYGEWDFEILANEWDEVELEEWGLELKGFENVEEIDEPEYGEDVSKKTDDMESSSKRAVMIEFSQEQYEFVFEKLQSLRKEGFDVGNIIHDFLKGL